MTPRKAAEEDPFSDVHLVRGVIERRIAQLRGEGPIGDGLTPSRDQCDAILGFVNSKRSAVMELRVRTYLAWLPMAAHLLGGFFLKHDLLAVEVRAGRRGRPPLAQDQIGDLEVDQRRSRHAPA
jgi:hypothetical protein